MTWPFGALVPYSYDLALVDPPWPTEMRSPKGEHKSFARYYRPMSFEAIAALPVGHLLKRDAVVILCCTWPLLLHSGDRHYRGADASRSRPGEVIKAWGLRYATGGVWHKTTKNGKTAFGTGYRARSSCEPFLICLTGRPETSRAARNYFAGLRREHSRKPDELFAWCERYVPKGTRFVELFSRESRPGWDSWGDEAGKFDHPPAKTGTNALVVAA